MTNPILGKLMQNSSLGNILQMYNAMRNSSDQNEMLNQLAMQNPQMKAVMQEVNKYGGDAQKAFYAMAQQKGVDPNSVLNMLK